MRLAEIVQTFPLRGRKRFDAAPKRDLAFTNSAHEVAPLEEPRI